MRKLICLLICLGILALGSTAPAANDAQGLRNLLDVFSIISSLKQSGQNEVDIPEVPRYDDLIQVSINDCKTKPGLWPATGQISYKETSCFKTLTVTNLPGGTTNPFYAQGLRIGHVIVAFQVYNKGQKENASINCSASDEATVLLFDSSIKLIMLDPNEPSLWILVGDIEQWPNGNLKSYESSEYFVK
jgi:hypothetical protein